MRFKQFIETFDPYQAHDLSKPLDKEVEKVNDPKHLVKIIETNCKSMLAAYRATGHVLYRGVADAAGTKPNVIITAIRPDRKPVQMSQQKHEWLEGAFKELGIKATRTNSIFCSAKMDTASDWGATYAIFVKDPWSGVVFDGMDPDNYAFNELRFISSQEEAVEKLKEMKPRQFDDAAGLEKVIKNRFNDILITGHSYIGISIGAMNAKFFKLLGIE